MTNFSNKKWMRDENNPTFLLLKNEGHIIQPLYVRFRIGGGKFLSRD